MEVKAFLIVVLIFGSILYICAGGVLLVYVLGNNEATKGKKIIAGIVAAFMAYWFISAIGYVVKIVM